MTDTGHIYKIICLVDPTFCYIGSTFNRLSKRFEMHREHFKDWLKGKNSGCSCFPYYEKYGIENFKIILIKSYEVCRSHLKDRRHLEAYETLWINRHKGKCCNEKLPIEYLRREKKKEYREKNKEQIAEKKKNDYEKNKEKLTEKVECECGCIVSRGWLTAHKKSQKHNYPEKNKGKVECECGCIVTKGCLSRHKKTQKHKDLMAQK